MINIKISAEAFLKIQTLVAGYEHEVGWYGTVEKITKDTYRIMDILVYPQYASAAYIDDRDTTEMPIWFQSLSDEEYNHKRFHGHSHVNMAVYPSGTDKETYEQFKTQNSNATINRFTIELIINKRFEMHWKFHDAETGKEYDNEEINVEIEISTGETMATYFEKSREKVRELKSCSDFLLRGTPRKVKSKVANSSKPHRQIINKEKKGFSVRADDKCFNVRQEMIHQGQPVLFDIYGTPYKIVNHSKVKKKRGTVLDSLTYLADEGIQDHFMVYDMKREEILTPESFKKKTDMFRLSVKDESVVNSKGLDVFVILV